MSDFISLALSTGMGPVVSVVIIFIMMGLVYKMAGPVPSVISAFLSTFALTYMDFLPLPWAVGIMFALVAGFVFDRGILDGH